MKKTRAQKEQEAVDAYFSPERSERLSRDLVAADREVQKCLSARLMASMSRRGELRKALEDADAARDRAMDRWLEFHKGMYDDE